MKPDGLTTNAALALRARHGPNSLPDPPRESVLARLARQFRSPLIYILLFALSVDLIIWYREGANGVPVESLAIGAILLLNALLGLWQELKAENALARLRDLSAPQAWALRDGEWTRIRAQELVPGDLVRLEAGDRVPADGTIIGDTVSIDESILTGESLSVDKAPGQPAYSGTLAVRGIAFLEVTGIGPNSTLGKLAGMLGGIRQESTPLERKLHAFGNRVARWALAVAVLMFIEGVAARGTSHIPEVLTLAVALAVAAVPEGLPAVLSLALALGVERMAKKKAIVRRLAAVEALGSVTVIVTDKTGTLTENRMTVAAVDTADEPAMLQAMAYANEATGNAGDPEDVAILRYANERGFQQPATRVSARPFESSNRYMRVTVEEAGVTNSYLKGAVEAILARSSIFSEQAEPKPAEVWRAKSDALAKQGYRVLAVARGVGETEQELEFLGLVSLWDPPRPEVPLAIQTSRKAQVRVIMATGDHPATAQAIAGLVGIENQTVLTGAEVEALSDGELRQAARKTSVFARVKPEHKLRLVEQLKAEGHVVAMTGDGVNDAPALKRSDIGVAMGIRGSDVSREVADLVLSDDNFATIVSAIDEGRGIYANVQKFIRFLFATNLAEILVIAGGTILAAVLNLRDEAGEFLMPLTAVQILWINLVTDGLPALSLALDRDLNSMARAPRPPGESLLDRAATHFVLITGAFSATVALAILGLAQYPLTGGITTGIAQSMAFQYLAIVQLFNVYPARRAGSQPASNAWVHVAVGIGLALQIAAGFVPPLEAALNVEHLGSQQWLVVGAAVAATWAVGELTARATRSAT